MRKTDEVTDMEREAKILESMGPVGGLVAYNRELLANREPLRLDDIKEENVVSNDPDSLTDLRVSEIKGEKVVSTDTTYLRAEDIVGSAEDGEDEEEGIKI
jgi:hypothetical protein